MPTSAIPCNADAMPVQEINPAYQSGDSLTYTFIKMDLYFLYVITFGGYFCLQYLVTEKQIKSSKEFIVLVLFPMAGYGNWLYNKALRENKNIELPRKWFIWRKMILQNFFLLLSSVIVIGSVTVLDLYSRLKGDAALELSFASISLVERNIDPTLGIGLFFAAIATVFYICLFIFLLIIIPTIIAKSIKKNYSPTQL